MSDPDGVSDPDGTSDGAGPDRESTPEPAPSAPQVRTSPSAGVGAAQVAMIALLSGLVGLVLGFGLAGARGADVGPPTERGDGRSAETDAPGRDDGNRAHGRDSHRWAPPPWAGREGGPPRAERFDPDELREWWDENVDLDEWRRFFEEEVRPELRRRADPGGAPPATPAPPGGD